MTSGQAPMLQQIEQLLIAPTSGDAAPTLASLEDTLTEGYAQALALEAERLRLERRLGEVARTAADPGTSGFAEEVSVIGKRLRRADGELSHLRALLRSLHDRAQVMRTAEAR